MNQDCPHCGEPIEQLRDPEYGHESVGDDVEIWVEGTCPHCQKPVSIATSGQMDADEVPSEEELIDQMTDEALEMVQRGGYEDVEGAVKKAVASTRSAVPWFHDDVEFEKSVGKVMEEIAKQTPDEWYGSLEYDHDADHPYRLTNATPCPNCGQEGVFNITVKETAQMIMTSGGDYLPDDIFDRGMVTVACNSCFEVVHEEEAGHQ